MRPIVCLTAAACLWSSVAAQTPKIEVRVDPRVELMSVIFRLAGAPEYGKGMIDRYTEAVEQHFGEFRDHTVVQRARYLRLRYGVSYDAVMGMAVHITDATALNELVPFSPRPATLDKRWQIEDARVFLENARDFVADTDFAAFLASNAELYRVAAARMQTVLDQEAKLDWFAEFFGSDPSSEFALALGLLNGGNNYGPNIVHLDGHETMHCVLGVWKTDADGLPVFDASVIDTVIHEFCHSYCNPLVEAHFDKLESAADKLFPHVADQMKKRAYGNVSTMMYESLVRACVVRYIHDNGGPSASREQALSDLRIGFLWVPELADHLERYEQARDRYPTLNAFMPEVATFFDEWADSFEQRQGGAPTIQLMVPANGAADVDPATSAIEITFDRPMLDGSWSFVGGGPSFPTVAGEGGYDAERRIMTLPVTLKPSWSYEFWLNRHKHQNFRSSKGVALNPVHVQFKTGPAKR